MRDGDGQSSAHFLGSGSGIHFIQNVSSLLAKNSATIQQEWTSPVQDLVPVEDDRLQGRAEAMTRSKQLWDESELQWNVGVPQSQAQLAFEELISWSQSYFEL